MTLKNRTKLYAHYKDLSENYVAAKNKDTGLYSTEKVRANAKEHVEAMLKQHPELEVKEEISEEQTTDLSKLTNAELKIMLDEKEIPYSTTATKAELIELLGEQ